MRIPVRSTAQIQPTNARATTRASPDMFGAAAGRALQGVSREVDAAAQRWDQMQDEKAAADARLAYARMNDALRERMSGENGYLTQTGQNAIDGYDQFEDDLERLRSEISGELDPRARDAFEQLAVPRRESALNAAARHQARERQTYQTQAHEAYLAAHGEQAVSSWPDLDAFGEHVGVGSTDIAIERTRRGEPAELVEIAQREYESRTTLTAITAALDSGAVEQAEALRDRFGDLLSSEHAGTVADLMESAGRSVRTQEATDQLVGRYGSDWAAMRREARAQFQGDDRDEVVRRINAREREQTVSVADQDAAAFDAALAYLQQDTSRTIDDLPASVERALTERDLEILSRRSAPASNEQQAFLAGIVREAQENPAALANRDPAEFRRSLSGDRLAEAQTLWRQSMREEPADAPSIPMMTFTNAQMDAVELNDDERAQAFVEIDRMMAERRPQTNQERNDVIQDGIAEFVIKRGFFGGVTRSRRIGDAMPDEAVFGVPPEYVDAALAAYRTGERTGEVDFTDAEREQIGQLFQAAMARYRQMGIERPTPEEIQRAIEFERSNPEG